MSGSTGSKRTVPNEFVCLITGHIMFAIIP